MVTLLWQYLRNLWNEVNFSSPWLHLIDYTIHVPAKTTNPVKDNMCFIYIIDLTSFSIAQILTHVNPTLVRMMVFVLILLNHIGATVIRLSLDIIVRQVRGSSESLHFSRDKHLLKLAWGLSFTFNLLADTHPRIEYENYHLMHTVLQELLVGSKNCTFNYTEMIISRIVKAVERCGQEWYFGEFTDE